MASTVESQLRELEQKYARLLEARVAELEGKLISSQVRTTILTPSESNSEEATKDKKDEKDGSEDKKTEESKGPKPRYEVVINQLESDSGEYRDKAAKITPEDKKTGQAFTYRKRLRTRRDRNSGEDVLKASGAEVDIHFVPLQELLTKVVGKYSDPGAITTLTSPFHPLVFSWETAQKEANRTDGCDGPDGEDVKLARADLKELLRIISTASGDEALDRYFKNRDDMAAARTITFETLWTLFPRGSLIISRTFLEQEQVLIVQNFRTESVQNYYEDEVRTTFIVVAYAYDWDGTTFNRVPFQFDVDEFSDKKGISELPFYPLDMYAGNNKQNGAEDIAKLKARLIERGKLYRDYCIAKRGSQTFQYNGTVCYKKGSDLFGSLEDDESPPWYRSRRYNKAPATIKTTHQGVVIVDFKSFHTYQPAPSPILGDLERYTKSLECSCSECKLKLEEMYRYSWDKRPSEQYLTDEQYLLCPPRVLGYSLSLKKWVQMAVNNLARPDEADHTNFQSKLQLNLEYKNIIQKSVESHRKTNIADYTRGKGKGLVILLWGVPGVGKTLTAESVASLVGKPLFSVGVADIGLEGHKVETNLQRVFDLAGLWEAVLLFDEADVFLEARDTHKSDMQRNTIVSVLLRVLEYYDGILFLTTNRLRSFDIAVQSRIHIAVEYGDLSDRQAESIFREFLGQLRDHGLVADWTEVEEWVMDEGIQKTFNGRQIRNLVSTAMALAHAEGGGLRRKHLSTVARNTSTFKGALADQDAVFRNSQYRTKY